MEIDALIRPPVGNETPPGAIGPVCRGWGVCQLACCMTFDNVNNVPFVPVTAGVVRMNYDGSFNLFEKKKLRRSLRKKPITDMEREYLSDPGPEYSPPPNCKGMFDKFDFDKPNPEGDASAA